MKKLFCLILIQILHLVSLATDLRPDIFRTPESRFNDLTDFTFQSNYVHLKQGLRMHYLDEGDPNAPVVLLLHGEPYWCYGFRNIMPQLVAAGYRVIAPDMIGFGKSDKWIDQNAYSYSNLHAWKNEFIEKLDITNIHLFAHDWGGLIALRLITDSPKKFKKVILSYAYLFTGNEETPDSFKDWVDYAANNPDFKAGTVMDWGSKSSLSDAVKDAYNAPFPNDSSMSGVRILPSLIPTKINDLEAIINTKHFDQLKKYNRPLLTIWGDHPDDLWNNKDKILQTLAPGSNNQPHKRLRSGHFIIEDQPEELSQIMIHFFQN